jgi:hypothetical protein
MILPAVAFGRCYRTSENIHNYRGNVTCRPRASHRRPSEHGTEKLHESPWGRADGGWLACCAEVEGADRIDLMSRPLALAYSAYGGLVPLDRAVSVCKYVGTNK